MKKRRIIIAILAMFLVFSSISYRPNMIKAEDGITESDGTVIVEENSEETETTSQEEETDDDTETGDNNDDETEQDNESDPEIIDEEENEEIVEDEVIEEESEEIETAELFLQDESPSSGTTPIVVREGVDFETDIDYKDEYSAPKITVTASMPHTQFRDFESYYTKSSTGILMHKDSDPTVEVDFGVVGTLNNQNITLKLTISDLVHHGYYGNDNNTNDYMEIHVGDDPQTGFILDNIYIAKFTYDLRYEDGTKLEDPRITYCSLNGNKREGGKPINAYKLSVNDGGAMFSGELLKPYAIGGGKDSSAPYPAAVDTYNIDKTGWWYDDYSLCPDYQLGDYVYNPVTGKIDAYDQDAAVMAYYEDSSNMQAYVTARNAGVWVSTVIVAKAPAYDLTIEKQTNTPTDEEFRFNLRIFKEHQTHEIISFEEDEFTNEAYAVFDSSSKTLTFFRDDFDKYTNGQVEGTKTYYADFETLDIDVNTRFIDSFSPPWKSLTTRVEKVVFKDVIRPNSTDQWFNGMSNLKSVEGMRENLQMHKVVIARSMFNGCRSLTSLDTSNFYTPSLCFCGSMFKNCSNLEYLDLSFMNFEKFSHISNYQDRYTPACGFADMFTGCSKLTTEIRFPNFPTNHFDVFNGAATAPGAQITWSVYLARPQEIQMPYIRGLARYDNFFRGATGNIVFGGFLDQKPMNIPAYIVPDEIIYKTEIHTYNLTGDDRFTYDVDTQTYSFTLTGGESLTIEDIPKGYKYEICEVDSNDNEMDVHDHVNDDWILMEETNNEGSMDSDITAVFKNVSKHDLTINKQTDIQTDESFDFKIKVWKDVEESYKAVARYSFKDTDVEYTPNGSDAQSESIEATVIELTAQSYPITIGEYTFTKHSRFMTTAEAEKSEHLGDYQNLWNDTNGYTRDSIELIPEYTGNEVTVDGKKLYELNWSAEYNGNSYDHVYIDRSTEELDEVLNASFDGSSDKHEIECYFYVLDSEDLITDKHCYEKLTSGNITEAHLDLTDQLGSMDEDGYYKFDLKTSDPVTVIGIPSGYKYEIYETDKQGNILSADDPVNDDWLFISSSGDSGSITDKDESSTFINNGRTTLIDPPIRKVITGDETDKQIEFRFCMQALNGAPMPEGSEGNRKYTTITGEGEIEFGEIVVTAGTYEYEIYEINGRAKGYKYDKTKYHLKFVVSIVDNEFVIEKTVTADGEKYEEMVFVFENEYKKPTIPEIIDSIFTIPTTGIIDGKVVYRVNYELFAMILIPLCLMIYVVNKKRLRR